MLAETLLPPKETCRPFRSEAFKTFQDLLDSPLTVEVGFRIKLVCITNHLLFQRFGQVVARRQGKVLPIDVCGAQSGACVPLAYAGYGIEALATHQLGTKDTMTQVRFSAVAVNTWRVRQEDTHVVQE